MAVGLKINSLKLLEPVRKKEVILQKSIRHTPAQKLTNWLIPHTLMPAYGVDFITKCAVKPPILILVITHITRFLRLLFRGIPLLSHLKNSGSLQSLAVLRLEALENLQTWTFLQITRERSSPMQQNPARPLSPALVLAAVAGLAVMIIGVQLREGSFSPLLNLILVASWLVGFLLLRERRA